MKKIYIIRHAKSSWKDMDLEDFDRPLNKRGELNAPLMGKRLKKKSVVPDIILSSSALRAKTTAKMIAKELQYSQKIVFKDDMYHTNVIFLHKMLKHLDDKHTTVFLFGHNSELNMLAEYYVDLEENIPTCGIVEIEFSSKKWSGISSKNATLLSFDYPKKEN
ncbi:MAG: phosphohistidine phosphatase [Sulfurimonas sp.]|jgi:phosphohistidine phosphatase|uniref:SixA phosphatase family protein n=1 Tax=Sulfurimonas sp. TaxID=2022749 RepID=UPI0039E4EE00